MRTYNKDRFRWEIRWNPHLPLYEHEFFLDEGSELWHIWPITIYKWRVRQPAPLPQEPPSPYGTAPMVDMRAEFEANSTTPSPEEVEQFMRSRQQLKDEYYRRMNQRPSDKK